MRQVILDMDLDFFVSPTYREADSDNAPRLPDAEYKVDDLQKVEGFLTGILGLSESAPIPCRTVKRHHEVLSAWEELIAQRKLRPPFSVVHVDADDDLYGHFDAKAVRSDNYLLHTAKRGWLAHLCYVHCRDSYPPPNYLFKNSNYYSLKVGSQEVGFNSFEKDLLRSGTFDLPFSFLFFAKSSAFTPIKADTLIPVIERYMIPF